MKVLAIGVKESAEQARSWSSQYQLTYPVMIDPEGEIYQKYGTGSVPYHVLIDKTFIIRHSEEKFDKNGLIQLLAKHI